MLLEAAKDRSVTPEAARAADRPDDLVDGEQKRNHPTSCFRLGLQRGMDGSTAGCTFGATGPQLVRRYSSAHRVQLDLPRGLSANRDGTYPSSF